jgi:hypothetical protein
MGPAQRPDGFVGASPRFWARVAGFFYLINTITSLAGFSGKVSGWILTACNWTAPVFYVAATILLYFLLRPVSRSLSLIALCSAWLVRRTRSCGAMICFLSIFIAWFTSGSTAPCLVSRSCVQLSCRVFSEPFSSWPARVGSRSSRHALVPSVHRTTTLRGHRRNTADALASDHGRQLRALDRTGSCREMTLAWWKMGLLAKHRHFTN